MKNLTDKMVSLKFVWLIVSTVFLVIDFVKASPFIANNKRKKGNKSFQLLCIPNFILYFFFPSELSSFFGFRNSKNFIDQKF